jgi:hypothetical protein
MRPELRIGRKRRQTHYQCHRLLLFLLALPSILSPDLPKFHYLYFEVASVDTRCRFSTRFVDKRFKRSFKRHNPHRNHLYPQLA